jgi:hypothetical protein
LSFYGPICIGSDLIFVYVIDYVASLFKIWGQEFKEKLKLLQQEKETGNVEESSLQRCLLVRAEIYFVSVF